MKNTISLNRNEQFLNVYRNGKRSYHKYFTLYYIPNNRQINRLGFKVNKKLAKAVKRNRMRRLLRESYRLNESSIKVGYDFILAAREGCLDIATFDDVSRAVNKMFSFANLFTDSENN